jgi:uncharacterized protein (TIGR03086 family)
MSETIDFEAQARLVARLAEHTTDDQLDAPTPCEKYAVRHVLGHLVGLTAAFCDAARKDLGPSTNTAPGETVPDVEPGWRGALERNLAALTEAWRAPDAWEGDTQAGGVALPAPVAGQVALNELVLHGWDLARATGQAYAPDRASLEVSYALLAPSSEGGGLFGPPVPVPDDAPLLDQVVALSGRRPGWAPKEA